MIPALEHALDDRSPAVAAMAAWALGETEDRASVPALLKLVRSGDRPARIEDIGDAAGRHAEVKREPIGAKAAGCKLTLEETAGMCDWGHGTYPLW